MSDAGFVSSKAFSLCTLFLLRVVVSPLDVRAQRILYSNKMHQKVEVITNLLSIVFSYRAVAYQTKVALACWRANVRAL